MKIIIYARVSTEKQNAETQLKDIKEIAPEDCEVVIEYQSAWKDHLKVRPKFKAIKEQIEKRKVSALYVWDFDRLYRNRAMSVSFMQLCEHFGCRVYSYRQRWFQELEQIPDPWGGMMRKFLFEMMAWMAEEESNKKSDRIKMKIDRSEGETKSTYGRKWGRPKLDIDVNRVVELKNKGFSCRKIGMMLGISHGKVFEVLKGLKSE